MYNGQRWKVNISMNHYLYLNGAVIMGNPLTSNWLLMKISDIDQNRCHRSSRLILNDKRIQLPKQSQYIYDTIHSICLLVGIKCYHHIINFKDKLEKYLHVFYHLSPSDWFAYGMNTEQVDHKVGYEVLRTHLHLNLKTEVLSYHNTYSPN
jgi:hypothetical protein